MPSGGGGVTGRGATPPLHGCGETFLCCGMKVSFTTKEYTRLLGSPASMLNVHEMKRDPRYHPLQSEPRFEALLRDPKNNAPKF